MRSMVVAAALCVASSIALGAGQSPGGDVLPVALVITYADGRTVSTVMGTRTARSWTPMFPRVPGWRPPRNSLPVAAINYVSTREADDVRVVVSVRFGQPHQREEQVAEVLVRSGAPVHVEALTRFGIEPIRLSLAPVGALALHPPVVENRTTGLTIDGVELVAEVPPRYRVTVRNRSSKGARSYAMATFRLGRPALSGRQADPRARLIVGPGATHSFDIPLSGAAGAVAVDGPVSPEPLDTIALTSVLWDDGTSEGDAKPAVQARIGDLGRLAQLRRVIAALERAEVSAARNPETSTRELRREIEALPIEPNAEMSAQLRELVSGAPGDDYQGDAILRVGMQRIKDLVLEDLATLDGDGKGTLTQWLARTLAEYREWRARLELPGQP
jgi:hypothetical protein